LSQVLCTIRNVLALSWASSLPIFRPLSHRQTTCCKTGVPLAFRSRPHSGPTSEWRCHLLSELLASFQHAIGMRSPNVLKQHLHRRRCSLYPQARRASGLPRLAQKLLQPNNVGHLTSYKGLSERRWNPRVSCEQRTAFHPNFASCGSHV